MKRILFEIGNTLRLEHNQYAISEYENYDEIKVNDEVLVYSNCSLWKGTVKEISDDTISVYCDWYGYSKVKKNEIGKGWLYKII
jgi:preprotein translocase subunit YajC